MRYTSALLVITFLSIATGRAQSALEVSGFYALGFQDAPLEIFHENIPEHNSNAYQVAAAYTYTFNSVKAMFGVGYKQISFSGKAEESGAFEGEADRPFVRLGARYLWGDHLETGLWFGLEGNRDQHELRSATSDNFRSFAQIEAVYRVWRGVGVSASYYRALQPLQDHYLIYNPANMLALGVNISLFE